MGPIALAVAPSKPQVVYANIESKSSALFRSDDGGKTWTRLDASRFVIWRPFYFANLIVDPKDENKIFKLDGPLLLSVNGGQSFSIGFQRRAWRFPRHLDRSGQSQCSLSQATTAASGAAKMAARVGSTR